MLKKHWTVAEFHQLGEEGWFEQSRPMLVEGEVLKVPLPNPPHATGSALTEEALRSIFNRGFLIRVEKPLVVSRSSDPVPAVAVVTGSIRDYSRAHPTTAVLVVEVSGSTLAFDTNDKACLYASAGITDYWVVDLVNRQVIVFRDPQVDTSKSFGFAYTSVTILSPGQSVSPLAVPTSSVAVTDLLP